MIAKVVAAGYPSSMRYCSYLAKLEKLFYEPCGDLDWLNFGIENEITTAHVLC
jgi:hypothetical protein